VEVKQKEKTSISAANPYSLQQADDASVCFIQQFGSTLSVCFIQQFGSTLSVCFIQQFGSTL
jgi:hypothetical protein